MPNCAADTGFPSFNRACTNNDSCVFGLHQINCCGSMQAIGFNHDQRDAFDMAERAWAMTCPQCGCAATLPIDDSGKTCMTSMFVATCDNGMCTSHCQ
jgi:hypothetical protein